MHRYWEICAFLSVTLIDAMALSFGLKWAAIVNFKTYGWQVLAPDGSSWHLFLLIDYLYCRTLQPLPYAPYQESTIKCLVTSVNLVRCISECEMYLEKDSS
jgi:hypothetical protein